MNDRQATQLSKYRKKKTEQKQSLAKEANQEIVEGLAEIKESLAELQSRPIELDNTETNKVLEQALEQVVELQKQSEGNNEKLVAEIVDRISKIRVEVNAPKSPDVHNKIVVSDWQKEYIFSDSDKSEGTTYIGFVNPKGEWYIEAVYKSKTSDKARFIFGKEDYVSNWGKRLQHNYKYLYEAING